MNIEVIWFLINAFSICFGFALNLSDFDLLDTNIDFFAINIFRSQRHFEEVFKKCSEDVLKTCLGDVLKNNNSITISFHPRRFEDDLKTS